jgi:hypothetical protein
MTVEERAKEVIVKFTAKEESLLYGKGGYGASFKEWSARLQERIEEALREQIEACAKIADDLEYEKCFERGWQSVADSIGDKIRARSEQA